LLQRLLSTRYIPTVRFISFRHGDDIGAGLLLADEVLHLRVAAELAKERTDLSSVLQIIRGGSEALATCRRLAADARKLGQARVPLTQVQLLAPIPRPARNAFCVGLNYFEHAKEGAAARMSELKVPQVPIFFTKATRTVIGPGAEVRIDPKVTQRLDYEVELAVIIGSEGRDITPSAALEYVFGYTIANDVTARDLQRRHEQWFKGKSLDTTLPLGPCIVSRDEIDDLKSLELSMHINGQERQRTRVDQMIFDVPTLITSLSAGLTLEPGDIIATGTPSGVGFAMNPPQYLHNGDEMVARIDRIGELRNRVVEIESRA
jgi:2-keto-4-pentenoate hydratase/2-oxohepta-3-ene-1,7-dioic acid hydratase in catechol pathway